MPYANLVETVVAEHIARGLDRDCIFAKDCHTLFEGKAKDVGESVKIVGLADPPITTVYKKDVYKGIGTPERVEDVSTLMPINCLSYFNFMVDDIDAMQSKFGIEGLVNEKTLARLASEIDQNIANRALDKTAFTMFDGTAQKLVTSDSPASGEVNVLRILNQAATLLYKNDVPQNTEIVANVSPEFYERYIWALGGKDTDNSEILEKGRARRYGNILVKMSNNVATSADGAVEHIMVRTKQAIAYARTHIHTEAYRPEAYFADGLKGFVLYDSKIVRPKELVVIPVKY